MKHWQPIVLYFFALGLLWLNTIPTDYLLGTDAHLEYYFAQRTLLEGWDPSIAHPEASALSVTILAPTISKIFHIPLIWVFKIVFPALFAFVPVILYYVFRKFFSNNESFLSSIFFIIVPTFAMEIAGIGRQQIAELFLAFYLLVVVSGLRMRFHIPLMYGLAVCIVVSHYSTGVVMIMITTLYCVFATFYWLRNRRHRIINWVRQKTPTVPIRTVAISLLLTVVTAVAYWGWAGAGTPLRYMTHLIPIEETQVWIYKIGRIPASGELEVSNKPAKVMNLLDQKYDSLMSIALGLDFMQASPLGKVFRFLQFLTQAAILIGLVFILRSRKIAKTYKVLALSGAALLGACIVIPAFAAILNATRWYHLALFLIAPAVVVPFTRILKKPAILIVLLISYGLFTSGIMFETTKQTDIASPNMPYSIGLSGQRLDLAGNFTEDDAIVREWIRNSDIQTIYSDLPGMLFLQETMALEKDLYIWNGVDYANRPIPMVEQLEADSIMFLRSNNNITGYITTYTGVGARNRLALDTQGMETIYKSGESEVIRKQ